MECGVFRTYSLTHLLTHLLTHPLTHSLLDIDISTSSSHSKNPHIYPSISSIHPFPHSSIHPSIHPFPHPFNFSRSSIQHTKLLCVYWIIPGKRAPGGERGGGLGIWRLIWILRLRFRLCKARRSLFFLFFLTYLTRARAEFESSQVQSSHVSSD